MRHRERRRSKSKKRRASCELLEPRLMLSATEAPVGDASFVLYDNSAIATVATDFSRNVETLDGLGNLVAADDRRFGKPLHYTPTLEWNVSERFEEIKEEYFLSYADVSFSVFGSGWDHDGQTPLAVFRASGDFNSSKLLFVRGEQMEVVGIIPLNSAGFIDQLANGDRTYHPDALIVHHGLVVIAAERYVAGYGADGVDFFTTQDYGQTLEQVPYVGGGFEVPPIEGEVTQGINRLQTWSFLNAFPVDGIDDTESAWFPWADYLGKESVVKPKGGQIGLFRADRSAETGEWVLSPNRLVHSEWNPEDTGGFHAHAAAVTTGGVISHWGDVGYRNVTKFHQFDLSDYQNATITTTDAFGGSDFTGQEYHTAPQPVATAPSPVAGEHFASGDITPEHVLSFGALENTGDRLEIEAKIFQAERSASGKVHDTPALLHMQWLQGTGYVTGGRDHSFFYYSPDGERWTEINSPKDRKGTLWFYGNHLIKGQDKKFYLTDALPEVETVRPLQISPGGENSIDTSLESYHEPGAGNTRRQVLYQNDAWRYADTLIPLDVQAPAPQFSASAPVYEITVGNQSTDLGGWWLDPAGTTHNAAEPYITETWAINLSDQSFYLGMGNRVIGESQSSYADLRYYQVADTTQWNSLGASLDVANPFDGEGRYATLLNSYFISPGSRFLVALPYAGESLAPTYSQAAQAAGPDELESVSELGFSDDWSLGLVARWPDNSQQRSAGRMPIASLTGSSGDSVELSFEYIFGKTQLYADFYKASNLVHTEILIQDLLRGDWVEIVLSRNAEEISLSYLVAGDPFTFRVDQVELDLSLDKFQWSAHDGDTVTGIDPVLAVFDNDLAWDVDQQKEWIFSSLADKAIYQAKPAVGDYNFDGEVNAADYTVWRDSLGSAVIGQPGDGADGDRSGFVDLADHAIWQQEFGTHNPTLSELRAAASASSSAGAATQAASQPEPALLSSEEMTENDTDVAAILLSNNRSPLASPRFIASRYIPDVQTLDKTWELLAAEDAYRVNWGDEIDAPLEDRLERDEEQIAENQDGSRDRLIDEALATIVL